MIMKGKVLAFDFKSGEGQISGDDGVRYAFSAPDWHGDKQPLPGASVDFDSTDGRAIGIYKVAGSNAMSGDKNRITAALLAFFLGMLGVHKFYLGKNTAGVIMLLGGTIGWLLLFIPPLIIATIAFIEFVIYLITSDEDFQRKYVEGDQSWF
jgi:TM2 domain-containing membrane protein YozV